MYNMMSGFPRGDTERKKHLLQLVQPVGDIQEHVPTLEHPSPLAEQVLECLRRTGGDAQDEVVVRNHDFLGGRVLPLGRPKTRVLVGRFARGDAFPLACYLYSTVTQGDKRCEIDQGWGR